HRRGFEPICAVLGLIFSLTLLERSRHHSQQSVTQPQLCRGPIPLYRCAGYSKSRCDFIDRKTGEKSQLNNLCLPRVHELKLLKSFIHRDNVKIAFGTKIKSLIQGQSYYRRSTSFATCTSDSIANQNSPHRPCCECKHVSFVGPKIIRLLEDPQKSFVQKSCRLQSVARTFVLEIFRGKAA